MKYNLRKGLYLLMAILCVGWVQAQTNTIYVSPSGNDGNQGTTVSPVKTLAKALELATSGGETIQLAAGTYTETTALNISKTVTIQGESGNEKPIISRQTITVSATNGAEVKFENLTLTPNNINTHAVIVSADAKVSMTNCSLHTCNTGVRMTGKSAELTLMNTDIDCKYYAISVRNLNQKVTVSGGTLTGWAAIMTSAQELNGKKTENSQTSIIVKDKAKLQGRSINADQYSAFTLQQNYDGVTVTIENSTIETIAAAEGGDQRYENAFEVRSYKNNITISKSTLSSTLCNNGYDDSANKEIGTGVISLGFRENETPPEINPSYEQNTITLTNCELHGNENNNSVFSWRIGEGKNCDVLTINETAYSPAAGNICYTAPTTAANLQSKINDAVAGEKIVLATGTYDMDATLTLNKAITIEGAIDENGAPATTLQRKAAWSNTNNDTKHMVNITASNVTLKNLVIDGNNLDTGNDKQGSGINVYVASGIKLENVISQNNKGGGLIVNGSNVIAENFHTEGNGYGINLDKGSDVTQSPTLTIDANCSVAESSKIYGPASVLTENRVTVPTGWITTTVTIKGTEYRVWTDKLITTDGNTVFANGYPVTIVESETDGYVRIFRTDYEKDYVEVASESAVVYGGAKDADVASTSITMAGGSLLQIYGGGNAITQEASVTGNVTINMTAGTVPYVSGGGYGNSTTSRADVKGKTTINISGGKILGILAAAGDYYAKSGEVEMTVSGSGTSLGWVLGGGYDAGETTNQLMTEFAQSVNGTSKTTISITDALAEYICAGGGQGYSYSKEVEATLNNVKIYSGLLGTGSNGRSDKVLVRASNCDFTPTSGRLKEIAAINRGYVTDSVKMVFENCKFPTNNLAVYACATWEWQDGNYPTPTTPKTIMKFLGCENTPTVGISEGLQDFVLNGADAKIDMFIHRAASDNNKAECVYEFAIPENKTWTFNNSLELTPGITLDASKGWLVVDSICKVATSPQLTTALNSFVSNIQLGEGTYEGFTISKAAVTIDGSNKAKIDGSITLNGLASVVTLKGLQFISTEGPVIVNNTTEPVTASRNYWNHTNPDFNALIGGTGKVNVNPYPYYNHTDMENLVDQLIKVTDATTITEKIYPGCNLEITSTGHATLTQANAHFGTVIINEGGQLTPPTYNAEETGRAIADRFVFNPTLENKWKALGTPFTAQLKNNLGDKADLFEETAETGIWFAGLVDGKPEIEVKKTYTNAGLWAANDKINYGLHAQNVTLESKAEPTAPTSGLQMCVNPNTYDIQLNQSAYVLNKAGTVFELQKNPEIKAFQSFVLADSNTTATLRSIGTTDPNATGNEFVVKEGYYLTTERGAIVVHTAEPMELYVVAVSGAVVYRGTVADGERIAVPTGFYAVNGQMVRVK